VGSAKLLPHSPIGDHGGSADGIAGSTVSVQDSAGVLRLAPLFFVGYTDQLPGASRSCIGSGDSDGSDGAGRPPVERCRSPVLLPVSSLRTERSGRRRGDSDSREPG